MLDDLLGFGQLQAKYGPCLSKHIKGLLVKNHHKDNVNPAVFMLLWYMDWYEQRDVDALLTEQPRVVIYDPERVTWTYDHYNNTFDAALASNYTRLGDSGWQYYIWVRNDSIQE